MLGSLLFELGKSLVVIAQFFVYEFNRVTDAGKAVMHLSSEGLNILFEISFNSLLGLRNRDCNELLEIIKFFINVVIGHETILAVNGWAVAKMGCNLVLYKL